MIESTVGELAELVGGRVIGAVDRAIRGVRDLREAGPDDLGFVRDSVITSYSIHYTKLYEGP